MPSSGENEHCSVLSIAHETGPIAMVRVHLMTERPIYDAMSVSGGKNIISNNILKNVVISLFFFFN